MKQKFVTLLTLLSWIQVLAALPAPEGKSSSGLSPNSKIEFSRDIRPIFADHCFECHGSEKQKSGFRLDLREKAMAGGDTGKAIIPGKSADSLLYRYIAGLHPDTRMPPKGKPLSQDQVARIRDWIDTGAVWPSETAAAITKTNRHWSLKRPERAALPQVRNVRWLRNPIDSFVLAKLESANISPSPEVDRVTLIRRLSLDLTGLPPSPEQVSSFVSDRRVDACDRLVDSLLASPHFGERWGRHWLDLARYADSEGYQIDHARPYAYVYRNWVIDAFNRDLPFDRFTIEQLAGDLLPNATIEQKTATGFHRNTLMNFEEGVDREEFRCKAKSDRVATTGTVWLGLTLGCAECHSHKYDPITQKEFYQLYALFNNAVETDFPAPQPDSGAKQPEAQAPGFRQSPTNIPTFIHVRGDFLRKGEQVRPGVVAALHPFRPRGEIPDRLDLAQWLVDPANPLTARVAVNHLWQHLLGRGLVATPEDFGLRGEPPSHPELLDWLATEFIRVGWSRKEMIKLIVGSATYRQSAAVREELVSTDPNNILLARQNRFRLESEIVRDLYLSCGGLLNDDLKGPSFRPPTPADFKALGGAGAFTWVDSEGPEKYRRGLYVFTQRTVPYPVSATFDSANPNESCPRRENSNTPLQALTLLNHPVFSECARGLGRRMFLAESADAASRISYGFELCLGRKPSPAELRRLEQLFNDERRLANNDRNAAAKIVGDVEVDQTKIKDAAGLMLVAQILMNLDEFLTRE